MLLENIQERYHTSFQLEMVEIGHLPLFNEDQELDPLESVKQFKNDVV